MDDRRCPDAVSETGRAGVGLKLVTRHWKEGARLFVASGIMKCVQKVWIGKILRLKHGSALPRLEGKFGFSVVF